MLTGAGSTDVIRAVSEAFFHALGREESDEEGINLRATKAVLQDTLNDFATKSDAIYQSKLLVAAVETLGTFVFLRSDGVMVREADLVEILGIGETSLIRYLTDTLYKNILSVNELAALGIFVVAAGKKYCPQYCGGQIDVSVLTLKESCYSPSENETAEVEAIFFKGNLSNLLSQVASVIK